MSGKKPIAAERFQTLIDDATQRDSFWVDGAKLELSEQIFEAMQDLGISESELSRRLGVSRAYVNKILKGTANLTIESLVKIGRALGREFKFEFAGNLASGGKPQRKAPRSITKASIAPPGRPVHPA
ncbi:MAG: helix-turn-helix transcriptional regulator [Pyrinomonadaceae bacterium]|nr:helix-turn-helix transcriptional regulator [Pyrinomonadaceae bacterium]MBP6212719.1 helix-turn-helix transcriptional regulator [Pyrinomonadaceae bacterium]